MLTADMLQLYGIDMGDQVLMRARTWPWLLALIGGCMTARSRISWERMGASEQDRYIKAMCEGAQVPPWL